MKALSRFASLAAASLAASLALGTAAHADALKCKLEIAKDSPKFAQAKIKALQKCNDKIVKGDLTPGSCPDGDTTLKINAAASKLQVNIAKKCGGDDKICGTGNDDSLASIGWNIGTCPNFEGGSCNNAIADCDDISTCLNCVDEAAVDQAISLYYDDLQSGEFGTGSDVNKCQRAIGKNATKFLVAKNKTLAKCEKTVLNGDIAGPCPDATVAQPAIAAADSKKRAAICKACGGADKLCTGGDNLTVAAIGFAASCPNVTIPGGSSCGGPISTVQDIVDCVDCVSEFKDDCLDPISVPAVKPTYPPECNGGGVPTPTPTTTPCPTATAGALCPTTVQADSESDTIDLDTGWTGISHDAHAPSNGRLTLNVFGCAGGASPPCGVCSLSGPIQNAGGKIRNNHRCLGDSAIECTADIDCGIDGPCTFFFGAPLPLSAGSVAVCVTNQITGAVTGTTDIEAGTTETLVPLTSRVHGPGLTHAPCPLCGRNQCVGGANLGADCGFASQCPGGTCSHVLKCSGGQNDNQSCQITGTSTTFGDVSFDCPPDPGTLIGTIPVPINYTSGLQTRSLTAASPNCRATGYTTKKCFCDTCNNSVANPCASNADCGPRCVGGPNGAAACTVDSECPSGACRGGTTCGAKRCLIGANAGAACTNNTQCPGGACDIPGLQTAPNQCNDAVCHPNPGDTDAFGEGVCASGPLDFYCGPYAVFAQCSVDGDCDQFNRCIGGTNQGTIACTTNADCPGGTCEIQTCSIQALRECFTDNGVIGTHCFDGTNDGALCSIDSECPGGFCGGGSVSAAGVAYPPCGNTGTGAIAGLFCLAPVNATSVNSVSGLPGLGRVTIPTTYTFN